LKEREHMEDLDVEGRMILKCIFKTEGERLWTGFFHIRIETTGKFYERGNEYFS
jgi:hypothetical protein